MRSRTRYRIDRVDVSEPLSRPAGWTFAGDGVHGIEHSYIVTDRNLPTRNTWEFIVRVPDDPRGRIEVRPRATPSLKVWAELTDRSLTFSPATKGGARGKWYCQVALADASGERSKAVVRTDQRQELPHWFDDLQGRMRRKLAVRSTNGTDGEALVVLIAAGDHKAMIRLFFATKVWVLKEGIQAPTTK